MEWSAQQPKKNPKEKERKFSVHCGAGPFAPPPLPFFFGFLCVFPIYQSSKVIFSSSFPLSSEPICVCIRVRRDIQSPSAAFSSELGTEPDPETKRGDQAA